MIGVSKLKQEKNKVMIIEKDKKLVVQSHDFDQVNCTIDAEDMRYVASLLRNNYSDSQLAIIREITANALDANIEAKSGKKVEVHAPSQTNPNFYVRDFGNGLSDKEIFDLYSKYGKSTKRSSNNYIGAFGIGKFAPLSYGDSFTVVSRNGGVKNSYNIYVDENDDTKIVKLHSESSDEDSGLEVSVAIATDDINSFNGKVVSFFKYFNEDDLPAFFGLPSEIEKVSRTLDGNGWFLEESDNSYHYGRHYNAHAVMGRIRYPINVDSMNLDNEKNGDMIRELLQQDNLHIEFEIGSLKLHHSRESIEYNKPTQAILINRANEVISEVETIAQAKLAEANDLWEAKIKYSQIYNSIPHNLKRLLESSFSWKGVKITSPSFDCNFSYDNDYRRIRVLKYVKDEDADVSNGFRVVNKKADKIYCTENTIIAIADCPSHGLSLRARTLFLDDEDLSDIQVINFESSEDQDAFNKHHSFDLISSDRVVYLSTVEKAILASKTKSKTLKGRVGLKEFNIHSWKDNPSANWNHSDHDSDDLTNNSTECVYFATLGNRIVREGDDPCEEVVSIVRMKSVLKALKDKFEEEDKTFPVIYGVQEKQCKKLQKSVWKNGLDWVIEQTKDSFAEESVQSYQNLNILKKLKSDGQEDSSYSKIYDILENDDIYNSIKSLGKDHLLVESVKIFSCDYNKYSNDSRNDELLLSFNEQFDPNFDDSSSLSLGGLRSMLNKVVRDYPVLEHIYIHWGQTSKTGKGILDYVNFCDSVKETKNDENNS